MGGVRSDVSVIWLNDLSNYASNYQVNIKTTKIYTFILGWLKIDFIFRKFPLWKTAHLSYHLPIHFTKSIKVTGLKFEVVYNSEMANFKILRQLSL